MGVLKIQDVKPGMTLEQAVFLPGSDKCLLKSGTILSSQNIDKLRELGVQHVEIGDPNTLFLTPTDKMRESLVEDYIQVLREISPERPEANKSDEVVKVAKQLEALIQRIAKNEDILNYMVEMRIINKVRLYDYSIYTAVLSGIVAGCMGMGIEEITVVVIGALLHDVGVAEMPNLIKIKYADFTPQQKKLWEEHPTYGYYFALQKNIPRVIATCIQCHHERFDGSGYPKGSKGEEIPLPARIISVCSSYAAAVVYRDTPPYMAVEEIYGTSGIYYDPAVVKAFVNNIPIYPLGVMVRLSTQEVGIVSNIRKNEGPRPIVKVYYNRVNRAITEDKVIDLGKERTIFIEEII